MPGPARKPFSKANQPAPVEKSAGWDVAREIRDRIAARRNEVLDAQFARALDQAHPQGHAAAKDLLDRIVPPESKTKVEWATDPDQMSDEQLAAIAAGRGGPSSGPAGNTN